ncbi:MAG: ATP-dependent DNA helicase [Chitinophagaceae bacterium]
MLTLPEKLLSAYEKEYAQLNSSQKKAVDTIEGPVMVIAGPGTGKTQILALRIAKILLETDAQPQNILCLTFTDAGTVAMRQRLTRFLGSDAYKVNIHTFHSFCNKVIQEQGRVLRKQDLEPLSELERIQFMKELIDGFANDDPLKRMKGEVYFDLGNLTRLYSNIKREAWEPENIIRHIDHYIDVTIPEEYTNKRNPEKGLTVKGNEEIARFQRSRAAVKAFSRYQHILDKNNRYDFDDMINWVIRLFTNNKEVLLSYQESLQYIMVDEYQDTSGSQNRIVELLTSYWEQDPNLFVVGDDDQSIYRFQGANIENMLAMRQKLGRNLITVVLTENYRSVQPILDAAGGLISKNQKRLILKIDGLTKDLRAARPDRLGLNIIPEVRVYPNEFSENLHITESIKQLIREGVKPGQIAVLYREHKFGDEFQRFLMEGGVPFYVKRSINLLEDPFIRQVLNFFRYINMENDLPNGGEYLLFEIMHYHFFQLIPSEIARITRERKGSLREHIEHISAAQQGLLFAADETSAKVKALADLLNNLQKDSFNLPLQRWFEKLINEAGILAYVDQNEDKIRLMEKLSCLFDHIKEETHRQPLMTLKEFVEIIDLMEANSLSLPLIQTTGNDTGVNLMTCHGSKGLEFGYVFLLGARSDIWEQKKKNNKGFPMPPSMFEGGVDEALTEEEDREELRRLFYVAITRAEKHLYISYPRATNEGKPVIASMFLEEIRATLDIPEQVVEPDQEMTYTYQQLRFGVVAKPVMAAVEKGYIDGLLAKFVMNVSALNNFLECPLGFYYTNLVKVPGAKSESASFGTAVHKALQIMYDEGKGKMQFPPVQRFLDQYRKELLKEREHFDEASFKRFTDHGLQVLTAFHGHRFEGKTPPQVLLTEYKLDGVALDEIPLRGFTDLITFEGNQIVITDFKTGDMEKSRNRFRRPGEHKDYPYGGNYWRQAVFYKILVDLLPKNWKVQYVVFDFVEPDKKGKWNQQRIDITPQDEIEVKQQIHEVWNRIRQHDFYTGCGKEDCSWCRFAKDNKIYLRLEEEEAM